MPKTKSKHVQIFTATILVYKYITFIYCTTCISIQQSSFFYCRGYRFRMREKSCIKTTLIPRLNNYASHLPNYMIKSFSNKFL